jgi:uridine nucleosidase
MEHFSAEAAQIVLNAPVKKTMIPLNVTHTAIVTKMIHARLLCPSKQLSQAGHLPQASTNLRYMLSSIITYFTDSYKSTFGFKDGPPIHDALTIAYVARPELFTSQRHRVDIELHGTFTSGETVVDMWQYQHCDDSWGVGGKNCLVAESIQVSPNTKLWAVEFIMHR